MSNRMLSEEKVINANVITRHNAIVISCDEQMFFQEEVCPFNIKRCLQSSR